MKIKGTLEDDSSICWSPSPAGRLDSQTRDELSHDLRRWSWLPGERDALSGPQRERFDVTGGADHRRRRLVADDRFAGSEVGDDLAHSGPALQRRPARCLPQLSRRVAERAVRRVRPVDVVEVGVPLAHRSRPR